MVQLKQIKVIDELRDRCLPGRCSTWFSLGPHSRQTGLLAPAHEAPTLYKTNGLHQLKVGLDGETPRFGHVVGCKRDHKVGIDQQSAWRQQREEVPVGGRERLIATEAVQGLQSEGYVDWGQRCPPGGVIQIRGFHPDADLSNTP